METFWQRLADCWQDLYKLIQKNSVIALRIIDTLLQDLPINISISYNLINKQELDIANGQVVLYLSPNGNKDSVQILERLYSKRITLNNLLIAKYRAYNENDDIPNEITDNIDNNNININVDEFAVHCLQGYNQDRPVLNLVITCRKDLLSCKEVKFMHEANALADIETKMSEVKIAESEAVKAESEIKSTSRPVYFYKGGALDEYLSIILGEYNLIHYIGYIEIIPKEDAIKEIPFMKLDSLRESVEFISKPYKHQCAYCSIDSMQMDLIKCQCKRLEFCSSLCLKASVHKC